MVEQSTRLWVRVLVSAAAGALALLSFPPYGAWPLAWVSVGLALWALRGAGFGTAFLVGLAHGAALFFPLVTWTSPFLGPLPWLALAATETLLTGAASLLIAAAYRWAGHRSQASFAAAVPLALAVASMFLVREVFLGAWPYSGFPWARVAMSQANGPVAASVSWVSISGLTFVIAVVAALIVEAVMRRSAAALAVPALLMALVAALPMFPTTPQGTVRIAAVQPDSKAGFFDERGRYDLVEALLEASIAIDPGSVDLVVWPEGFDGDPFADTTLSQRLRAEVSRLQAPLLANAAVARGTDIYNTSLLWTAQTPKGPVAEDLASHAKRNPVPFGEYVPDRAFYEKIVPDLIGLIGREYTAGTDAPLIDVSFAQGTARIALAICFDVIYDEVIREGILGGGELFVFQTNNADFRGTPESEQQLAFARMRAFETGRAVINISTIGTSAIVAADGTIEEQLAADVRGVLIADVERRSGITAGVVVGPYVEAGALILGIALTLGGAVSSRREQRREQRDTEPMPSRASS